MRLQCIWVVWTAASCDCFHPLVCPNPFSYSCCSILYSSSLARTAQYCSCVTVCAHCTCIVYTVDSVLCYIVYSCVFIIIVACVLPCMQEWTMVEASGGPGQPWPEGRSFHSALRLHDSDSNPANPELIIMWGLGSGRILSEGWVFGVDVQQWRKVRQSVSNT